MPYIKKSQKITRSQEIVVPKVSWAPGLKSQWSCPQRSDCQSLIFPKVPDGIFFSDISTPIGMKKIKPKFFLEHFFWITYFSKIRIFLRKTIENSRKLTFFAYFVNLTALKLIFDDFGLTMVKSLHSREHFERNRFSKYYNR